MESIAPGRDTGARAATGNEIARGHLRVELTRAMEAARGARQRVAALVITLVRADRLDAIFGAAPDELMRTSLARLAGALRNEDRFVRLSDEKLCLLLPGLKSDAQALLAATKLIRVLEEPIAQPEGLSTLRAVAGIACYPDHASNADQLVVNADIAERLARVRDLPHYMFQREDRVEVHAYLGLESALREALATNQLEVHYQPQLDIATRTCVGVEALLRWSPPERGSVAPDVVVRIAEENGLIGALTTWIANTVVRHQAEWRRNGLDLRVSINLSTVNLVDTDLPDALAQMIGTWGADPSRITLEITESATIDDAERSLAVLRRLKGLGLQLSVDDFGTGYSSLSYVKRFPLDELKIDKLFVQHMRGSRGDQAIVRSVIDLAHNFDLSVVAEGVEDAETLEALTEMGCDMAQGFHISPALPADALLRWLEEATAAEEAD